MTWTRRYVNLTPRAVPYCPCQQFYALGVTHPRCHQLPTQSPAQFRKETPVLAPQISLEAAKMPLGVTRSSAFCRCRAADSQLRNFRPLKVDKSPLETAAPVYDLAIALCKFELKSRSVTTLPAFMYLEVLNPRRLPHRCCGFATSKFRLFISAKQSN